MAVRVRRAPMKEVRDEDITPGYKFIPTDEELLTEILAKKGKEDLPPPTTRIIHDVDNLHQIHPADLAADYRPAVRNQWYFFTSQEQKCERHHGCAHEGHWQNSDEDMFIHGPNEEELGVKSTLSYYEKLSFNELNPTSWVMNEYALKEQTQRALKNTRCEVEDRILCRIYDNSVVTRDYCYSDEDAMSDRDY